MTSRSYMEEICVEGKSQFHKKCNLSRQWQKWALLIVSEWRLFDVKFPLVGERHSLVDLQTDVIPDPFRSTARHTSHKALGWAEVRFIRWRRVLLAFCAFEYLFRLPKEWRPPFFPRSWFCLLRWFAFKRSMAAWVVVAVERVSMPLK